MDLTGTCKFLVPGWFRFRFSGQGKMPGLLEEFADVAILDWFQENVLCVSVDYVLN